MPSIKNSQTHFHRDIFLRELISNSCDAIKKLRLLQENDSELFEIHVQLDPEKKTLIFKDNGIGMTEEEVEKSIGLSAFLHAKDFLDGKKEPIQLGFYSSCLIAQTVEIETLSYLPNAKPVRWVYDGKESYKIEEGSKITRGTDVILHLGEASAEFLDIGKISDLLRKYCPFASEAIFLNHSPPLWIKNPAKYRECEQLESYSKVYPGYNKPIGKVYFKTLELLPYHCAGWHKNKTQLEFLIKQQHPRIVIEVGSWTGLSTCHIASLLDEDSILYAVDHWLGSSEHQDIAIRPYLYEQFLSNVIHSGFSFAIVPIKMTSMDAATYLPNILGVKQADFIYIDASHETDEVFADLTAWYPFVRGHGILSGDDWLWPSVQIAVQRFAEEQNLKIVSHENFWCLHPEEPIYPSR